MKLKIATFPCFRNLVVLVDLVTEAAVVVVVVVPSYPFRKVWRNI